MATPKVAIIMGSDSDWPVMKQAAQMLTDFGVDYEAKVVSAHRTPDLMFKFAEDAATKGFEVIIAGAGGAAHLPGMVAAKTTLPVLGVPVPSKHCKDRIHCSLSCKCLRVFQLQLSRLVRLVLRMLDCSRFLSWQITMLH